MPRTARLVNLPITELQVHDATDLISDTLCAEGGWERYETALMCQRLFEGATFVDIGANIGYYTCIASRLVGETGRVVAFEPESSNFALLQANVGRLGGGNVELHRVALGERATTAPLYLSVHNFGDHSLAANERRRVESVDIVDGDSVLDGRVDFIKIDTQGAEADILAGLAQTIERSRDRLYMIVEFWPWALMQQGASVQKLLDRLARFTLYVIDHQAHRLLPASHDELARSASTVLHPARRGFVNLLVCASGLS